MKFAAVTLIFIILSGLCMDAAKRASQVEVLNNRIEVLEAQAGIK